MKRKRKKEGLRLSSAAPLLASLAILLYWMATLHLSPPSPAKSTRPLPPFPTHAKFTVDRQELHLALLGDALLQAKLLRRWDAEAAQHGLEPPLSPQEYLLAQRLAERVSREPTKDTPRVYPQTYLAASIASALHHLSALPEGIEEYSFCIRSTTLPAIRREETERLQALQIDTAIVAPYSHPATVEAIRKQGIAVHMIEAPATPEELFTLVHQIGEITGEPTRAALLALFLQGGFRTLDQLIPSNRQGQLYLHQTLYLSLPTSRTLTGYLVHKLGLVPSSLLDQTQWSYPVSKEELLAMKPTSLILSSYDGQGALPTYLQDYPVTLVEGRIQTFSSHLILLAYYDLIAALQP